MHGTECLHAQHVRKLVMGEPNAAHRQLSLSQVSHASIRVCTVLWHGRDSCRCSTALPRDGEDGGSHAILLIGRGILDAASLVRKPQLPPRPVAVPAETAKVICVDLDALVMTRSRSAAVGGG